MNHPKIFSWTESMGLPILGKMMWITMPANREMSVCVNTQNCLSGHLPKTDYTEEQDDPPTPISTCLGQTGLPPCRTPGAAFQPTDQQCRWDSSGPTLGGACGNSWDVFWLACVLMSSREHLCTEKAGPSTCPRGCVVSSFYKRSSRLAFLLLIFPAVCQLSNI